MPQLSPCDDNTTASTGAQTLTLDLTQIPREWLLGSESEDRCDLPHLILTNLTQSSPNPRGRAPTEVADGSASEAVMTCEVFDIFATPNKGKGLGALSEYSATIPPRNRTSNPLTSCCL